LASESGCPKNSSAMRRAPIDPRLFPKIAATWFPLRVTIQQSVETRDKYGAVKNTWGNVAGMTGIPGTIVPNSQTEVRGQQFVQTETTHQIMLGGHFPAITPKMRARGDDGGVYDITGVEADPWHSFTQLRVRVLTP
jgi:head-tail adaptor